ncbi:MAG: hypothetical protein H0W36_02185 [Gemmatimonadetes bacterium]|nr:hypothetical protein [Gemmatimonadota bacterium]
MSNAQTEARREEVRANFETMEKGAEKMQDGANRMRVMRQIDELKARSAPLMADPGGLREATVKDESGRYEGIDASDDRRAGIKAEADERVKAVAEKYGVNGEAAVERHSGGVPSKALAEQFKRAEEREREQMRMERGEGPESAEDRRRALSQMRSEVAAIYREARERADRGQGRAVANQTAMPEREEGRAAASDLTPGPNRPDASRSEGPAPAADATRPARNPDGLRQVEAERAAERTAADRREATKRELDRQNQDRDRRERDDGVGV